MATTTPAPVSFLTHPAIADLSLNEVLAKRGLTHERTSPTSYRHHVRRHGEIIFTGDADAVWKWLDSIGALEDLARAS